MVAFYGFNSGLEKTRADEYHSIVNIIKVRGKAKFEVN